jgi:hypothetical protein
MHGFDSAIFTMNEFVPTDFPVARADIVAYSSAPTGIISFVLTLWGVRLFKK